MARATGGPLETTVADLLQIIINSLNVSTLTIVWVNFQANLAGTHVLPLFWL